MPQNDRTPLRPPDTLTHGAAPVLSRADVGSAPRVAGVAPSAARVGGVAPC